MKLDYKKTICVGFAFFLISMFWQVYDTVVAKILIDSFGLNQFWSGAVLALDNVIAVVLLPVFGKEGFGQGGRDELSYREGRTKQCHLFGYICLDIV